MNTTEFIKAFKRDVCDSIELVPAGTDRFRVATPFMFDDGDGFVIVLKKQGSRWLLTDEGHTFMHLSYWVDTQFFEESSRKNLIDSALKYHGVENDSGELIVSIDNEKCGQSLFRLVQCIVHIIDTLYLKRDRTKSSFDEDLRVIIEQSVPENKRTFNWSDLKYDPQSQYAVDCKIDNHTVPILAYGVHSDDKCKFATIALGYYRRHGMEFRGVAVYENMDEIGPANAARLTDVCDKQFSNLEGNRDSIAKYFHEYSSH